MAIARTTVDLIPPATTADPFLDESDVDIVESADVPASLTRRLQVSDDNDNANDSEKIVGVVRISPRFPIAAGYSLIDKATGDRYRVTGTVVSTQPGRKTKATIEREKKSNG